MKLTIWHPASRPLARGLRAVVLTTLASAFLAAVPVAGAQGRTPANATVSSPTMAVQLASPAVVRIVSVIQAQLICHACLSDGSDIDSPASGQPPFEYFSAGSGAFITSDGYILTADHVVDHTVNNPEDVAFIEQAASQDIANQYPQNTAAGILQFLQNNPNSITINMQVTAQKVFLSTAYTGDLQSTADVVSYDVTRTVINSPVTQDDTAIIKVEATDMPYLNLAPPNSISVGDQVTAIAYPADADNVLGGTDFSALLTPSQSEATTLTSLLDASVNTGQVTAKKNLANGTPVYEAGSISSQGSSGGPVVDDQGRIIGFVDAGPSSGTDRLTFLVPSEVIAQYVKQSGNSNPTPGPFQTLWVQANQQQFSSAQCHWNAAASDFQQLRNQYPHFGAVDALLTNAQQHAGPNACPPPAPVGLIALVLLVLVGGGVGGFLYYTRRRGIPVFGALPSARYNSVGSVPGPYTPTPPGYTPPGYTPPGYTPPGYPSTPPGYAPTPGPYMPTPPGYTPPGYAPTPPGAGGVGDQPTAPSAMGYALPGMTPPPVPTPPPSGSATPPPGALAADGLASTPAPVPVAQPVTPAVTSARVCANGHPMPDVNARFCPECGAPVA